MLLIRAFGPDGLQWLDTTKANWDDAEELLEQLDSLCPESKVSIVDLKTGLLTMKDRKVNA